MELMKKKAEADQVQAQLLQHKKDVIEERDVRKALYMSTLKENDHLVQLRKQERQIHRVQELQDDKMRLTGLHKFEDDEKARSIERLKREQSLINEESRRFQNKQMTEKEQKLRDDAKVRGMIEEYDKKFIVREENYRNVNMFFKAAAEHQKKLEKIHTQYVAPQEKKKALEYDLIVRKNMEEEKLKREKIEIDKAKERFEVRKLILQISQKKIHANHEALKAQLDFRSHQREQQKHAKLEKNPEYEREWQILAEEQKKQRVDKVKHQFDYKHDLDQQHHDLEERKRKNKMTKQEKALNSLDLQAYKQQDPTLYALIPGFHNSKENLLKNLNPETPETITNLGPVTDRYSRRGKFGMFDGPISGVGPFQKKAHFISNSINQLDFANHLITDPTPAHKERSQGNQSVKPTSVSHQDSIHDYGMALPSRTNSKNDFGKLFLVDPATVVSGHNPILNPLPVTMQNPYLKKQLNRDIHRFGSVASNNILGSKV